MESLQKGRSCALKTNLTSDSKLVFNGRADDAAAVVEGSSQDPGGVFRGGGM